MTTNWVQQLPTPEAFRLNRLLYDIQHDRSEEQRFFADRAAYIAGAALSDRARQAMSDLDIGGLYSLGANPYLLRAFCLQLRMPEPDYLAALRAVGDRAHG